MWVLAIMKTKKPLVCGVVARKKAQSTEATMIPHKLEHIPFAYNFPIL